MRGFLVVVVSYIQRKNGLPPRKYYLKQHFGEIKNEVFFKERRLLRLKGPVR